MHSDLVHKALLQPQAYPEAPAAIEFRETHVSRLYFTPEFVYKVKKPVDFGFLNFIGLDRRRFYCEEEVRLNRRFAPDTYLGVKEIRRGPQGIRLDGEGELLDFAVWMKRLPAERMLDALIAANAPELPESMDALAGVLARLESHSEICRGNGGVSNYEAVRRNWRENFDQTVPFVGQTLMACTLETCRNYVEQFMQDHQGLLLQREEVGYVRDGHGDLHAEHICLTDPIRIYDCIEFNRRFRVADVAADLAFILMDLDVRNRRDLADRLQSGYLQIAGPDPAFSKLLPFYKVYRAFVRGKVNTFLWADENAAPDIRHSCRELAQDYFSLALGYLLSPCLVLTCGLMGTGKSTLAKKLSRFTGAQLLRSDVLRKELAGISPEKTLQEDFGQGLYTADWTTRTYDALATRTATLLRQGRSVIVDASFAENMQRRRFLTMAQKAGVAAFVLHLEAEDDTLSRRLQERVATGGDASDGRPALLQAQKRFFELPDPADHLIHVDANRAVSDSVEQTLCAIVGKSGYRYE
jgi:uncharacterized protein